MKHFLLFLSLGSAAATTLAFHEPKTLTPEGSQAVFVDRPDTRLLGLPATSGTTPVGSGIDIIAFRDPLFAKGRALFDKDFRYEEGLGAPEMNADSCRGCHQDPVMGGAGGLELNVSRFADDNDGLGPFVNLPGGQGLSKFYPPHVPGREEYDYSTATVFEQRQTPSVLGDGLIDRIPAAIILANEDPTDANSDGIFGVARMLTVDGNTEVGRFGWKAQVPHLRDFAKDAMGGELGVTTPDDGRGFAMISDSDAVSDPELSEADVDALTHFMQKLPRPERAGSTSPAVAAGEALFTSVGCAICHIPTLTGPTGPVPLYSNLLLHDVMPADFRGMSEPGADVGMFRTPPLWGIRDTAPYMHDGRAEDLIGAILAHESEAAGVVQNVLNLSPQQRASLLAFLEDL